MGFELFLTSKRYLKGKRLQLGFNCSGKEPAIVESRDGNKRDFYHFFMCTLKDTLNAKMVVFRHEHRKLWDGQMVPWCDPHQCVLGSIPGRGFICGLSLFVGSTSIYPSPQKPKFLNSNSSLESVPN